jgi:L-lactate dehydrogenase complex protein LldG
MSSRESILSKVKQAQPELLPLIEVPGFQQGFPDLLETFRTVATGIGGKVVEISSLDQIKRILDTENKSGGRIISTINELGEFAEINTFTQVKPHELEDVELAIIRGHFAVAENSAIWVTDELMGQRVVPYIAQHLAIVVNRKDIIAKMHEAYERIGSAQYEFGCFIAGPSKTADIEQSLVLGAHGPRSLLVFVLN